jgi:cell pole-organizing protein PopZ
MSTREVSEQPQDDMTMEEILASIRKIISDDGQSKVQSRQKGPIATHPEAPSALRAQRSAASQRPTLPYPSSARETKKGNVSESYKRFTRGGDAATFSESTAPISSQVRTTSLGATSEKEREHLVGVALEDITSRILQRWCDENLAHVASQIITERSEPIIKAALEKVIEDYFKRYAQSR